MVLDSSLLNTQHYKRYRSKVKWVNPGKGVAPSSTPSCSSYWKGSLWVTLNYGRQLYLLLLCWILLWPEEIEILVIVLCRRLLRGMCVAESSLALDTLQNKSWSRLLFWVYDKQTNNVEVNFGLDWPQMLVRGCQFTFTYTPKSSVFLPSQIMEEQTSTLDNISCRQISKILL